MRVHLSSVVTIFVALLFVSGTAGCRSNGGDWYKPGTYSWVNPFDKDRKAPQRSADAFANGKPRLESQPNISTAPGGYSDGTRASSAGISNPWEQQQNRGITHTPPSHIGGSNNLGGYSAAHAEPSSYPPTYMIEGHGGTQQSQYQQPPFMAQGTQQSHAINPMQDMMRQPQNSMPYGPTDYVQTGLQTGHLQAANSNIYPQQMPQHAHSVYGDQVNYAPFGPVTVPTTNYYEQPPQSVVPGGIVPSGGLY